MTALGTRVGFEPATTREPPTAGFEPAALPGLRPARAAHARSEFPPGGDAEGREGPEGEPAPAPGHGDRDFGHSPALRYRGSAAVRAQRAPAQAGRALAVPLGELSLPLPALCGAEPAVGTSPRCPCLGLCQVVSHSAEEGKKRVLRPAVFRVYMTL